MPVPATEARQRLIVALDPPYFPGSSSNPDDLLRETKQIVKSLGDTVVFYKVGLRLITVLNRALEFLKSEGKEIFLDIKSMDIPETVEYTVKGAASFGGIKFVTVNHGPYTVRAAKVGLDSIPEHERPGILFVPLLTSLDEKDLRAMFLDQEREITRADVNEYIKTKALEAVAFGTDGVVCSDQEVEMLRGVLPPDIKLVVPGIRPSYSSVKNDDQKRTSTPYEAIKNGADYLVVGRPIITAPDREAAAQSIVEEIQSALPE